MIWGCTDMTQLRASFCWHRGAERLSAAAGFSRGAFMGLGSDSRVYLVVVVLAGFGFMRCDKNTLKIVVLACLAQELQGSRSAKRSCRRQKKVK